MKWFKHFSDNHRGQTVQTLMNEFGHAGPCAYYFIMEMCAEKLESKEIDSGFVFTFKRPYFDNILRMKRKSTDNILRTLSESGVLKSESNDNEVRIEMPILANLLDRDMKKPRLVRALNAQNTRLDKDKDKDKELDKDLFIPGQVNKSPRPARKRPSSESTELNKKIWKSYFDAYFKRYNVEPIRNATVNTQISKIGKRLGEDSVDVVAFFVSSNNSLYLQSLHQVGLCLMHAESLHTQWRRGRAITQNDVRSFEKNQAKFDAANSFSLGFDDERKLIE